MYLQYHVLLPWHTSNRPSSVSPNEKKIEPYIKTYLITSPLCKSKAHVPGIHQTGVVWSPEFTLPLRVHWRILLTAEMFGEFMGVGNGANDSEA